MTIILAISGRISKSGDWKPVPYVAAMLFDFWLAYSLAKPYLIPIW